MAPRLAAPVLVAALVLAGCGASGGSDGARESTTTRASKPATTTTAAESTTAAPTTTKPKATTTAPPTTTTTEPTRCVEVPSEVTAALESGVDPTTGVTVDEWAAVESEDFESVFFVAGHLTGPGVDEVAVWATNKLDGTGLYFSVDGMSKQFSDWGDGGSTDAALSMSDDGAEEAADCL